MSNVLHRSPSVPSKGTSSVTEAKSEGLAASSKNEQTVSHVSGTVPRTFFQKTQAALTLSLDARAAIGFISDVYLCTCRSLTDHTVISN